MAINRPNIDGEHGGGLGGGGTNETNQIPASILFYEEDTTICLPVGFDFWFEYGTIYDDQTLLSSILEQYFPTVNVSIYQWKITRDEDGLIELWFKQKHNSIGDIFISTPTNGDPWLDCIKFKGINGDYQDYIYAIQLSGRSGISFLDSKRFAYDENDGFKWYRVYFNKLSKGFYRKNAYSIQNDGISSAAISHSLPSKKTTIPKEGRIEPDTVQYVDGSCAAWVPGYFIQDSSVSGTICNTTIKPKNHNSGFGYSKTSGDMREYRGDKATRYWDLIPGAPKILVHNFNTNVPEWDVSNDSVLKEEAISSITYNKAEQLYGISVEGVVFKKYKIGAINYLDSGEYTLNRNFGYSETDKVSVSATEYEANRRIIKSYTVEDYPVVISSYLDTQTNPLEGNKINISLSNNKNIISKTYNIDNLNKQKIILCVRQPVSLQESIDSVDGRRFFYIHTPLNNPNTYFQVATPFQTKKTAFFSTYAATSNWLKNNNNIVISPNYPFCSTIYESDQFGYPNKNQVRKENVIKLLANINHVCNAVRYWETSIGGMYISSFENPWSQEIDKEDLFWSWAWDTNYYDCFDTSSSNKNNVVVNVNINDIQYYDITDYMKKYYTAQYNPEKGTVYFANTLTHSAETQKLEDLPKITPAFKSAIETTHDNVSFDVVFNGTDIPKNSKYSVFVDADFPNARYNNGIIATIISKCFNQIKYTFNLKNYTSFNTSTGFDFRTTHEEVNKVRYPHQYDYHKGFYVSLPCCWFTANSFFLTCPPIFSESYVSFAHDKDKKYNYFMPSALLPEYYVEMDRKYYYDTSYNKIDYRTYFYDQKIENKDNKKFYLTYGIPGWNGWIAKGYECFMPSVWPISKNSDISTLFSPSVEYWNTSTGNANPPQIGFNYGMVINSPWCGEDSVSKRSRWSVAQSTPDGYKVPKNSLPGFGIIVCEDY